MADIVGTSGNDTLVGTDQSDRIDGQAGNDVIDGRGGDDVLIGGPGDDIFYVDTPGDVVLEDANGGNDVVYATSNYTLGAGSHVETLSAFSTGWTSDMNLTGNEFDNVIAGTQGANILYGGGGGADVLVGFGGNDTYIVDGNDVVLEDANGGNDVVYATSNYTLGAGSHVETLSAFSTGWTSDMNLTGNEFDNVIAGTQGANILYGGGGGADVLVGFGGNDTYIVDGNDVVLEDANGGNDVVYATSNYTLGAGSHVETLSAFSTGWTSDMNLTGNEFDNVIAGTQGANVLYGGSGGADVLIGFGGNDTYIVDGNDVVLEDANGGNDVVYATSNYTLGAGSHVETLSAFSTGWTSDMNLTGNEFDNVIAGTQGANVLYGGGGGADVLIGFGGNDTYIVDGNDVVLEDANGGTDVVYAVSDYTLGAGSEVETLSAFSTGWTSGLNLTGNEFGNVIAGTQGANILDGKGGNDYLLGFGGSDSFAFTTALGAGNVDTIADFQPGTDKIQLGGNAGEPFVALASGALAAGSFVVGAAAADANDYIIYNSATGALLYDADGNGAGAAVQFATLSTGLGLTATDFTVSGPANHAPTVTSNASASVPENSPASTIVYQATATDADGDRITWALGGTDAAYLSIDAVTGAVRLINSADFETKTSYAFTVTSTDSGSGSAPKPVTLNVTDVADTSTPTIDETNAANDTYNTAQAIDRNTFNVSTNADLPDQTLPSATIHGSISTNNDIDYYAITLQAGEKIVLDVDHTTNSLDSFVRFYGPNGVELVNNDDKISSDPGSSTPWADHNTDSYLTYRVATSGTYYFSIESFGDLNHDDEDDGPNVGESNGNYSLNVSIGPPATAAQIMDEDIDALLSGAQWNHLALTYAFPTDVSQYPSGIKEISPATNFSPFTVAQQGATVQLLQLIANVSSLTFTPLAGDPGHANIRYAMSSAADVAYAYYPTNGDPTTSVGGTAWFNKTNFNNPIRGNYAWMGILHETGHTLGLKHPFEAPAVSAGHDSVEFSVMTYRSYVGGDLNGYTNESFGYPQTLMMLDIAAIQRMYGANFNYNSGNSVYTWSPMTGEMSINGAGQGAPGDGGAGSNRIFMTVWDGGGNDTYDLSNYTANMTIDLRPGEWSLFDRAQEANLGPGGHFARGNVANALLYNDDPRSLIENAIGGSSSDVIIANQAVNRLTGNGGEDTFAWTSVAHSRPGEADTVTDFLHGSDRLDFSQIDAKPSTPTDDGFIFLGTDPFTHAEGQIRYEVIGGNAHVYADVNGDAIADMEIILNNATTLSVGDFFF